MTAPWGERYPDLEGVIGALRKPRDEAQLTQVIAAVAASDASFAAKLAQLLLTTAPNPDAVRLLGDPPLTLQCRAEVQVFNASGADRGRVDLVFEDHSADFCLFAELKLASHYGETQLCRYRDALEAKPHANRGLIAATTLTPHTGEEEVETYPRWLGSVRWFDLIDEMRELDHCHKLAQTAWRAWLDLLRQEGDFGPMDFDPRDIEGWARRDQAESFLFSALSELAKPTEALLREAVGQSAQDEKAARILPRGKLGAAVVVPWKNKPNVQYAVPAHLDEQRFRIQFLAYAGEPFFTVEARYEHPKEPLGEDPTVAEATAFLAKRDINHDVDGDGHCWAYVSPASDWLFEESKTLERLTRIISEVVPVFGESRIFDALSARTPPTPAEPGPPQET